MGIDDIMGETFDEQKSASYQKQFEAGFAAFVKQYQEISEEDLENLKPTLKAWMNDAIPKIRSKIKGLKEQVQSIPPLTEKSKEYADEVEALVMELVSKIQNAIEQYVQDDKLTDLIESLGKSIGEAGEAYERMEKKFTDQGLEIN